MATGGVGPDRDTADGIGSSACGPAPDAPPTDVASRATCLFAGSPGEVLARIVQGDPLGIRDVVAAILREECVFLDADRVHLRSLARVARAASRFAASRQDLWTWLRAEVAAAVAELLREAVETPRADPGSAFVQFARPLGLDPESVRRGCAAFNRLPRADRAAFHALVVRNVGLEVLMRETGESASELGRRARRGLDAVLHASHPELPPPTRAAHSARPPSPVPNPNRPEANP